MKAIKTDFEWQYLVIAENRREWLGLRYFRFSILTETCIQICIHPGEQKKGRGHVFGVYCISRLTLFSNYLSMGYARPCRKSEYDKAFKQVIDILK